MQTREREQRNERYSHHLSPLSLSLSSSAHKRSSKATLMWPREATRVGHRHCMGEARESLVISVAIKAFFMFEGVCFAQLPTRLIFYA